jgi:ribosome-binding factor A
MSQRLRRVNESVKEIVAETVQGLKDPRIGFVTITDVRTSSDLRSAEVYWTVLPDDETTRTQTEAGLRSAAPLIRRELGGRLRTRLTPDLQFVHDEVPEQGRRIEELLRGRREADAAHEEERAVNDGDR